MSKLQRRIEARTGLLFGTLKNPPGRFWIIWVGPEHKNVVFEAGIAGRGFYVTRKSKHVG